jgi:hypothetical protein
MSPSVIIHPCWVKGKIQAVSRRKLEPWVLSKIVYKKRKRKEEAQSGQIVITVSSVATVPGRRAKFIARKQDKKKGKQMEIFESAEQINQGAPKKPACYDVVL